MKMHEPSLKEFDPAKQNYDLNMRDIQEIWMAAQAALETANRRFYGSSVGNNKAE